MSNGKDELPGDVNGSTRDEDNTERDDKKQPATREQLAGVYKDVDIMVSYLRSVGRSFPEPLRARYAQLQVERERDDSRVLEDTSDAAVSPGEMYTTSPSLVDVYQDAFRVHSALARQVAPATDGHDDVGTKPGGMDSARQLARQQRKLFPGHQLTGYARGPCLR